MNGLFPGSILILRGRGAIVERFCDQVESVDDGNLKPS
jgi:hypothetical protein